MTETEPRPRENIVVTFHPQEWVDSPGEAHDWGRKQLIPAKDREPATFVVPPEDGTDGDGNVFPDRSYEANQLQTHQKAPDWVTGWDGPYFVTTAVDSRLDRPDSDKTP